MEIFIPPGMQLRKLVNRLIRESFGNSFRGDLNYVGTFHTSSGEVDKTYFEIGELEYIAKRGLFLPFITTPNYHLLGKFKNKLGDYFTILPDYLKQAKQYASLYEAATHRDVKIEVFDRWKITDNNHILNGLEVSRIRHKLA